MLTRWEVEGQLRSLHPRREQTRRLRFARSGARRRVRRTVGVLVGIGLMVAITGARMRWARLPVVATLQDTEWGETHVGASARHSREPLFPPINRHRWDSWSNRARASRNPFTGKSRRPKIARE